MEEDFITQKIMCRDKIPYTEEFFHLFMGDAAERQRGLLSAPYGARTTRIPTKPEKESGLLKLRSADRQYLA